LIGKLADEAPPDVAVMELSSFQLELFSPDYQGEAVEARRTEASRVISLAGWSPSIAAITNITPNHLDRHPSMEDYVQAKANIAAYQAPTDWLVLNLDNEITRRMIPEAIAQVLRFSLIEPVADGAFMADDALWLAEDGATEAICRRDEVRLRGVHNIANVLAAACCARAGGVEIEAIRQVATTFAGVAHRLEMVGHWRERTFINDSIATSPERAIAALHSFDEPLVLLAGGRDKHLPWDDWADLVLERARVVVAFGEAVPIIDSALAQARGRRQGGDPALQGVHAVETLEEALERAAAVSRPGDVVLLSPGGTSFDAYKDFEERGRHFRQLVGQLQGTVA
jgi:UDP-N-acetylmuramoylalanine--D-glutamate ligase